MKWNTFLYVAVSSSLVMIIGELIFNIYPAWRRAKIAQALVVLAQCLAIINRDGFAKAKIQNGSELHDRYYKFLFNVLMKKVNLRFSMFSRIGLDETTEEEDRKFRAELDALDGETRAVIDSATYAVGKILLLRNPIIFLAILVRIKQERNSLRKKLAMTAEYITINASEDDYSLVPMPA